MNNHKCANIISFPFHYNLSLSSKSVDIKAP
jgi:hypothetical protein